MASTESNSAGAFEHIANAPLKKRAPTAPTLNAWTRTAIYFGFWTLVGLAASSQLYINSLDHRFELPWAHCLSVGLRDWLLWGLLTLPIIYVSRSFQLERKAWRLNLLIHIATCLAVITAYEALNIWAALLVERYLDFRYMPMVWHVRRFGTDGAFVSLWTHFWWINLILNVTLYSAAVSVHHAMTWRARYQERELHALDLAGRLTRARLTALQMQLRPHFLFNTLNAISTLVHRDPDVADEMITNLSELLRLTLTTSDQQKVPLRDELELLDKYLGIEQLRFASRLEVRREIDDDALDALVPCFIFQPLAENAIRYGIEPFSTQGVVTIQARLANKRLTLRVSDSGKGLNGKSASAVNEGIGLSNTRSRLGELYDNNAAFKITAPANSGMCVEIELPVELAAENESSLPTVTSD